jgi:hypothetical protein
MKKPSQMKLLCDVCGEKHRYYNDGYDYLDCILAHKMKEKRDYKIEIWDISNRRWVRQKEYYKDTHSIKP